MRKAKYLIILFCLIVFVIYSTDLMVEFIEDLGIPAGVGVDIEKNGE